MSFITGKSVLVTGAAGSIGSEICRQLIAEHGPVRVIAFDNSELGLYNLKRQHGEKLTYVLGDVTDSYDLARLNLRSALDVIFHAAAYKHVALCEANQYAAWKVNYDGTKNIVDAAQSFGIKTVVLISTDKAVNPSCEMGRSKRAAELHIREHGYTVVRLGNVAGSSGSVIPLWKEQIERGVPVTITDKHATRYFINPTTAARRIIAAAEVAPATYVVDMGQPEKVVDVAYALGARRVDFIGLQPGEKLHEELFKGTPGPTIFCGLREDLE